MEHLTFDYPAQRAVTTPRACRRGRLGRSGSAARRPPQNANALTAHVVVRTSVDGYSHIWKSVLDRFFTRYDGAAQIEINDFGATPGVVALRLAEAVEAAEQETTHEHACTHASAPLLRDSFIELPARERARSLLDPGTFRELLGPFDRIESPWLPLQGVVCQADDGCVIARGTHRRRARGDRRDRVGVPGRQHRRSVGQQDRRGARTGAARLRARHDRAPVVLFETGGVRLQEANLGLAVIAEIQAAIVALRRHVPVVGVIAGMVGCFGGMSLAAALCIVPRR